ncbi:hypothetical protein KUTeg_024324 [Tegillarca granosa]|uniref:VPS37 C-terminal domain-containing protein n=1 Tax=Tegillarca granosa TaxID=220873 RepID=A0ABQ9E3C3_TEGGR|nr:hypothetical protein KUTeg_024324 [Tegillarca granosa]
MTFCTFRLVSVISKIRSKMMNRLFGKTKGSNPSQTNLQAHRAKQIDSLKRENLNPIETIPNTEYRVTFLCNNNNITLVISLPPQFPQDPPSVTAQPFLCHPWVDNQAKVVGCPNLQAFSMHSSLAVAVKSIIEEFKRNPPQIIGTAMPYPSAGVPPTTYPGYNLAGYPAPPTLPTMNEGTTVPDSAPKTEDSSCSSTGSSNIPDVYTAFPDLKNKSNLHLAVLYKMLCACCSRLNTHEHQVPHHQFEKTMEEYEQDQDRLLSLSDQFNLTNIQTNLKVALLEAEEESEKMVDDFLSKKIDIDEFRQNFIKARSLCHSRRAKEEKLNQMILHQGY